MELRDLARRSNKLDALQSSTLIWKRNSPCIAEYKGLDSQRARKSRELYEAQNQMHRGAFEEKIEIVKRLQSVSRAARPERRADPRKRRQENNGE